MSLVWPKFIARRLIGLVLVGAILCVAVFGMVQLVPGDPVTNALGLDAPPAVVHRIAHENGFDKPLIAQFGRYVQHLAHGDLGRDFATNEPVTQVIKERIGTSLQLAGAALLLVVLAAFPIGIAAAAATREGRRPRLEGLFVGVTSVLGAVPDYLTGTILAFLFAVELRLLPVAGSGNLRTLVLPALAVAMAPTMTLSRIVRSETANVLSQTYIRTARSKQLSGWRIYGRHVLPNVLTAALTVGGVIFTSILGGAVVVENVFARPGLGTALVTAIITKDYPVVQGIALILGIAVVLVTSFVDIMIALIDPRSLARHA